MLSSVLWWRWCASKWYVFFFYLLSMFVPQNKGFRFHLCDLIVVVAFSCLFCCCCCWNFSINTFISSSLNLYYSNVFNPFISKQDHNFNSLLFFITKEMIAKQNVNLRLNATFKTLFLSPPSLFCIRSNDGKLSFDVEILMKIMTKHQYLTMRGTILNNPPTCLFLFFSFPIYKHFFVDRRFLFGLFCLFFVLSYKLLT